MEKCVKAQTIFNEKSPDLQHVQIQNNQLAPASIVCFVWY